MNGIVFCIMLIFGRVLSMKKYLSSHSSVAYSSIIHQPGLILYSSHPLQHFAQNNKKEREINNPIYKGIKKNKIARNKSNQIGKSFSQNEDR